MSAQSGTATDSAPGLALSARGLTCERDGRILFEGLEFALSVGAALQIEGANGAGKSTLIRTLIGTASDYQGHILWRGVPLPKSLPSLRESLLYIGHNAGVRRGLTPLENLAWYGASHTDALVALDAVGLYGFEDVLCQQLSAGQTRRVALARLYLPETPSLWILDEPLAALDVAGVASLETQMTRHLQRGGSVLLTSHQPVTIAPLAKINLADFQASAHDSLEHSYAG
ncbi:cytochrome c biogenesis heme-transporting ATPase CcmA [uncultured Microbulbifer sp.]|uniref:cytochrome c biogenesis heme-transporting ATPase CcmA n=1 Tax=uncultured Microbulbifer sp. TaxID=348147 RepID=UPI0026236A99|nr:cytochrome c biogenesis heme-transporting ATPase CcmA [uncultured Microbulbifer sp.]